VALDPKPLGSDEILILEGEDVEGGSRTVSRAEVNRALVQNRLLIGLLHDIDKGMVQIPLERYLRLPAPFKEALNLFRSVKASMVNNERGAILNRVPRKSS
jgi:hypothetical protein